jgi:hypothetical protein
MEWSGLAEKGTRPSPRPVPTAGPVLESAMAVLEIYRDMSWVNGIQQLFHVFSSIASNYSAAIRLHPDLDAPV